MESCAVLVPIFFLQGHRFATNLSVCILTHRDFKLTVCSIKIGVQSWAAFESLESPRAKLPLGSIVTLGHGFFSGPFDVHLLTTIFRNALFLSAENRRLKLTFCNVKLPDTLYACNTICLAATLSCSWKMKGFPDFMVNYIWRLNYHMTWANDSPKNNLASLSSGVYTCLCFTIVKNFFFSEFSKIKLKWVLA